MLIKKDFEDTKFNMNNATRQIDNAKKYQGFIVDPEVEDYFSKKIDKDANEENIEEFFEKTEEDIEYEEGKRKLIEEVQKLRREEIEKKALPSIYYKSNKKLGINTHFTVAYGLLNVIVCLAGYPFSLFVFPFSAFGIHCTRKALKESEENRPVIICGLIFCIATAVILFIPSFYFGLSKLFGIDVFISEQLEKIFS